MIGMLVSQIAFKNARTDEQIKQMVQARESVETDEKFIESLRSDNSPSGYAVTITSLLTAFGVDMAKFNAKHQLRFYQAGIHSPNASVNYFLFTRVLSVFLVGFALYTWMQKDADMSDYLMGLILLVFGIFGADIWIKNLTEKRAKTLQRSFPDVLDLLLACVESGLALDGALLRVCKELGSAHPMITEELNRLRVELSLLNDRSQALMNFSDRNGLLSFRMFVTALLQSEKFGTSLTDTLRVLSEDYRNQRMMKAEEKAGRLPALITIPLITFLLPALFIIILSPAVITSIANFHK
jgi:tight adherence protein C